MNEEQQRPIREIAKRIVAEAVEVSFMRGVEVERERIIKLLTDLNAIRRDALGFLVAFNTEGNEVIYLDGLELSE